MEAILLGTRTATTAMGFLNWRCHEVSDLSVFDQTIVHCNIACSELNRTCSECFCCQRIAISISLRKYPNVMEIF